MPRILGLDVGIGSCGWGVVDLPDFNPETGEITGEFAIVAAGARCFDVPEVPKTKELKNKARRLFRGQRRVIRRRRQRLRDVRALLASHGLQADPRATPKGTVAGDVYHLRAQGLDRRLDGTEWARVLVHMAKHRGFKSNSKRDRGDNSGDGGRMLRAVRALTERSQAWRTVGEMLARDPRFADRKRNRRGDYSHTLPRDLVEHEARELFAAQRRLGNLQAGTDFQKAYTAIAFFQRPLKESLTLVGACRFLPEEKRAPKQSPSFELFRFLSKLNVISLAARGTKATTLTDGQRRAAMSLFASHKDLSYAMLRRRLELGETVSFEGVARDAEKKKTFATCSGSHAMREALGDKRFFALLDTAPELLDGAATALAFFDDLDSIRRELEKAGLNVADIDALMSDESLGRWSGFSGVGHISAKACRLLIPHLEAGRVYSEACAKVGWDHATIGESRLDDLRNPVVRKVVRECLGQVNVIFRTFGIPDLVHLEMARQVGLKPEDRKAIADANEARAAERRRAAERLKELAPGAFGHREPSDEEILRFELWSEQNHRCPYTLDGDKGYISPERLVATDNGVQVDHILPYSRSGDDSFRNKVLCLTGANQAKGNRTPWEWFGESDPERWARFEAHVNSLKGLHKEKRRKLLTRSFARRETEYRDRHLNDSRYAMRILRHEMELRWPELATRKGRPRRFFARPGAVTAMARKGWGVDWLKKEGVLGDRDHALDALVVACTSESLLQWLTRCSQRREETGGARPIPALPTPLGDSPQARERFRRMLSDAARNVFVSRPETRLGRGALHKAEMYGFAFDENGKEVQFERMDVVDLRPADLERLKGDPKRNERLKAVLTLWLERAEREKVKPAKLFETDPPRMPRAGEMPGEGTGPVIRHLRLRRAAAKAGLKVPRGDKPAHVDQDTMTRVDVFSKGGKFYLVPIYAWQVATLDAPPDRAIVAHKPETEWTVIDDSYEFLFSLYPGSYVRARNRSGEVFEGYYTGTDRQGGQLTLAPADGIGKPARPGTKLLAEFRKYHVDRLGNLHEIAREPRLWRGAASS